MALDVRIYHDPDNGSSFVNLKETRVDYVVNERTGERTQLPYDHGASVSLGDYAIREGDDILIAADEQIAAGKMKPEDRPVLPAEKDRAIIGYRLDDFIAARTEFLTPLIGKDLSPIVSAASAKLEAAQAIVALAPALIADAEAQAAKIIDDARKVAAVVEPAELISEVAAHV
jgi:hypothetical protein